MILCTIARTIALFHIFFFFYVGAFNSIYESFFKKKRGEEELCILASFFFKKNLFPYGAMFTISRLCSKFLNCEEQKPHLVCSMYQTSKNNDLGTVAFDGRIYLLRPMGFAYSETNARFFFSASCRRLQDPSSSKY